MFKIIYLMSFLFLAALCAPLESSSSLIDSDSKLRKLPAVTYEEERDEQGQYTLHYVTAEGIEVFEKGWLVPNANGTDRVLIVEGSYSYIATDGNRYTTKYRSDVAGGFQPDGEHLPKAPKSENPDQMERLNLELESVESEIDSEGDEYDESDYD